MLLLYYIRLFYVVPFTVSYSVDLLLFQLNKEPTYILQCPIVSRYIAISLEILCPPLCTLPDWKAVGAWQT